MSIKKSAINGPKDSRKVNKPAKFNIKKKCKEWTGQREEGETKQRSKIRNYFDKSIKNDPKNCHFSLRAKLPCNLDGRRVRLDLRLGAYEGDY